MQSGGLRPIESWLLKTPAHQAQIDAILKVYPDARFVTTYREPTDVVVSSCSLVGIVTQMAQNKVDWAQLGKHISWHMEIEMYANVTQRRKHADKAHQFVDLSMQEIVKDPVDCVNRIYEHFNIEMTEKLARAMDA